MLSPDTILQQRYRVLRQLGQGGMGAVYEATDERLDTIVALKETLFTDERLRKQFEREARLLARLHHPALPRVSDHFTEGDGQFLVMQYIAGEDLAAMLHDRKAAFAPEEVLRWADQLCDALDYLHTQDPQIIHRDIKPQNLKLTARGQIVLLDFGLAKGSAGQMSVVTTSASIFGYTPNYAPLEQVQGLGTDARSDIYSLAATLYHLITNVKPPDALSRAAAIVNGEPDPLTPANRVAPRVSLSIASALNKGMSQNRSERYTSAAEMREALPATAAEPTSEAATVLIGASPAVGSGKTVSPEDRTRPIGASTRIEGSEAQTLVAADTTNVQPRPATPETATIVRPRATGRGSRSWFAAAILLVLIGGGAAAFYAYRLQKRTVQPASNLNARSSPDVQQQKNESPQMGVPQINSAQVESTKPAHSTAEKTTKAQAATERPATTKQTPRRALTQTNVNKEPSDRPTHEAERAGERGRDQNFPQPPETPRFDPFKGHPPGTGQGQLPSVRTFPNGTKVIRQPDGTRIVVMPDGSTRVFPPKTKININPRRNP
jgi:eukaryotic-like serine/threonine-protein kinase